MWSAIKITTETGSPIEYNAVPSGTNTKYTFTIPSDQEFTGFYVAGQPNGCNITSLSAYTRDLTCIVSFDLSAINGKSQKVIIDQLSMFSFTATPSGTGCGSSFEYQVTYTPASATSNLIYLSSSTSTSVSFA
jgi:hypothetical protein